MASHEQYRLHCKITMLCFQHNSLASELKEILSYVVPASYKNKEYLVSVHAVFS
ncbi:hypothetical protein KY285_030098 [Solanum tuberosum]|nr:hypothetical protein KY285_030098 [Solanum tuberosum]